MRLTNLMRQGILRAVMADLPALIDHSDAIRKRVQALDLERLPPLIQRVVKDKSLVHYLDTTTVYLSDLGYVSVTIFGDSDYDARKAFERKVCADDEIIRLAAEHKARHDGRNKAEANLRRDLELCATDTIFRERFPDLAKYLPAKPRDAETQNLPATTATMNALRAAGWPTEAAA